MLESVALSKNPKCLTSHFIYQQLNAPLWFLQGRCEGRARRVAPEGFIGTVEAGVQSRGPYLWLISSQCGNVFHYFNN